MAMEEQENVHQRWCFERDPLIHTQNTVEVHQVTRAKHEQGGSYGIELRLRTQRHTYQQYQLQPTTNERTVDNCGVEKIVAGCDHALEVQSLQQILPLTHL